jgi:hypothetical protein
MTDTVARRQASMQLPPDEAFSNVVDPISQDFDFVNNLPPLDAFDSILWYVTPYLIWRKFSDYRITSQGRYSRIMILV